MQLINGAIAIAALLATAGCATGGAGSNPPLPGGGSGADDTGSIGSPGDDDGGSTSPGDDATGVEGDDSGSSGSSSDQCNDAVHGLRALVVLSPMKCTASTDCPTGDCCYVNSLGSACVMQ